MYVRRSRFLIAAATAAGVLSAAGLAPAALATPSSPPPGHQAKAHKHKRTCTAQPRAGQAACNAELQTQDDGATPNATTSYQTGLTPTQLRTAYGVPRSTAPATIAIVDAFANPNAAADLTTYRNTFGLPTTKPLQQFRQDGTAITATNKPAADVGWGQEESLDLDMASALCPDCQIIYVGANSASFTDLMAAVKTANAKGARVISNSYGGSEFRGEAQYQPNFNFPGTIVTISSGDSGYGPQFPAALGGNSVVAVGGTALKVNANGTRASETAWSGAGSGCSRYVAKPTWQTDRGCSRRTIADVSAVADPNTGVAVYDSFGSTGGANWFVFGGTSVAAPVIGAIYAAVGIPANGVASTYAARANLFDVVSGSNGSCGVTGSSTFYLCHAGTGYDGPTGLGSPNNTTPF
jgi:subtilase family serine protease